MKTTDRTILLGVIMALLLGGFYMFVLNPKRTEATKLGEDVALLQDEITTEEQTIAAAEQARKDFPRYYGRMVVLGKAVPAQADSASLLVQLDSIASKTDVQFNSLQLGAASAAAGTTAAPAPATLSPAPATPAAGNTPAATTTPPAGEATATATPAGAPTDTSGSATASTGTTTGAPAPAVATESAAATIPIGATVGPAGLPTMPYDLAFKGDFFKVADFIAGIDGLVHVGGDPKDVVVDGRLLTIDGFSLQGGLPGSSPELEASFLMTSYVTPSEQGLTLGATPGAPAPVLPEATPAAAVTP